MRAGGALVFWQALATLFTKSTGGSGNGSEIKTDQGRAEAEQQQKLWATLIEILKTIITLSAAFVGSWAIIFTDLSKMPADKPSGVLMLGAVVAATTSLLFAIISLINVNGQIIDLATSSISISDAKFTKGRHRIMWFANLSLVMFLVAASFIVIFAAYRATMSIRAGEKLLEY